jgi:phenylpropionate dioxygenase-like ring-hydroxylating dioxygenase large terminal subunit
MKNIIKAFLVRLHTDPKIQGKSLRLFFLIWEFSKYHLGLIRHFILPRKFYLDDDILEAEYKYLFGCMWILAGLTIELKENKSWIKKKIGHKEILITHEDGQYFAIENICPHKNMQLCKNSHGKGTLVCDYHAWSFNSNGTIKTIPFHDRSYKFGKKQKEMSNMTKFEVRVIGAFIFVKLQKNSMSIEKQFDPAIIKSLKLISKMLQDKYGTFFETRDFNWKMNFENLRDSLHPPVLHAATLGKEVDFSAQYQDVPVMYKMLGRIPLWHTSSFSKDGENIIAKKGHLDDLIKPSFPSGYYNWLLFPNVHMATPDGGRSYSIEIHNPIAPGKTEISHYVIVNKPYSDDAMLDEIIEHRLRGLRPVLEEDYQACERIQHAIKFTEREQNIGCYEHYNANIASLYRKIIKK